MFVAYAELWAKGWYFFITACLTLLLLPFYVLSLVLGL
jgi:hypothetical protein